MLMNVFNTLGLDVYFNTKKTYDWKGYLVDFATQTEALSV